MTETSGRDPIERDLLSKIDVRGPMVEQVALNGDVESIVVEASSPGLKSVQITIPVSNDPSNGVLEVARSYAGKVVDFLDIMIGDFHWYIFNVADSAVTTGMILFILHAILIGEKKPITSE